MILIYDIFKESRKQFGYRRIKSELFKKHNILMNFKKIIKLMKSFSMIVGYLNRRQRKNKHLVGKNRFNVPDLIKRGFNKIKNRFII
ncbi:IS3 family transposase [Mesoplasma melaleucae]|uniref:HTH-like domain-containing protein n=1 Tax=Mesoplasma melaleucae TaxID=81459 RepID=A0A2K8NVB3_9MOLU|nr:hypothetical protein EMELA_v1c02070 [Mesoplasma melaleucae]